jgi:hypothetical protein
LHRKRTVEVERCECGSTFKIGGPMDPTQRPMRPDLGVSDPKDGPIDDPWHRAARAHAEARSAAEPEERAALLAEASQAEAEVTRETAARDAAETEHQESAP